MPPPSAPGVGLIIGRLLPPDRLTLPSLTFQYPLKLISSSTPSSKCLTVFVLSYGGGLVSNDVITLSVAAESSVKMCLLTQGSTKIFPRKSPDHLTAQNLNVTLHPNSTLLLLPDPIQPFADSAYKQTQRFVLPPDDSASIIMLDWVTEGRSALNEHWSFHSFVSRNEFFLTRPDSNERLMLRDAMILERYTADPGEIQERMDRFVVFATMVIHGPRFGELAAGVLKRFSEEPRIGGKNWDNEEVEKRRWEGVVWTAADVRGFVMVKAAGTDLQEVRGFLRMLLAEGPGEKEVIEQFGTGCLLCLQ